MQNNFMERIEYISDFADSISFFLWT